MNNEEVEMSSVKNNVVKYSYLLHHSSFLMRRDYRKPRPQELGSEHWKGSPVEQVKLRKLLDSQKSHK